MNTSKDVGAAMPPVRHHAELASDGATTRTRNQRRPRLLPWQRSHHAHCDHRILPQHRSGLCPNHTAAHQGVAEHDGADDHTREERTRSAARQDRPDQYRIGWRACLKPSRRDPSRYAIGAPGFFKADKVNRKAARSCQGKTPRHRDEGKEPASLSEAGWLAAEAPRTRYARRLADFRATAFFLGAGERTVPTVLLACRRGCAVARGFTRSSAIAFNLASVAFSSARFFLRTAAQSARLSSVAHAMSAP